MSSLPGKFKCSGFEWFSCPEGITLNSGLTGPNKAIYIYYIYIYIYIYILINWWNGMKPLNKSCFLEHLIQNVWRKSLTATSQECCEQYWTSPGGSTPQNCSHILSKVKMATTVEGDQRAPFSIATKLRCSGGRYFFP